MNPEDIFGIFPSGIMSSSRERTIFGESGSQKKIGTVALSETSQDGPTIEDSQTRPAVAVEPEELKQASK